MLATTQVQSPYIYIRCIPERIQKFNYLNHISTTSQTMSNRRGHHSWTIPALEDIIVNDCVYLIRCSCADCEEVAEELSRWILDQWSGSPALSREYFTKRLRMQIEAATMVVESANGKILWPRLPIQIHNKIIGWQQKVMGVWDNKRMRPAWSKSVPGLVISLFCLSMAIFHSVSIHLFSFKWVGSNLNDRHNMYDRFPCKIVAGFQLEDGRKLNNTYSSEDRREPRFQLVDCTKKKLRVSLQIK